MSRIRTPLAGLFIVSALFWVGCDRSAAAPDRNGDESTTAPASLSELSKPEQERLKALETAEKQRVERARASSLAVYDSLETIWANASGPGKFGTGSSSGSDDDDYDYDLLVCEPLAYAADVKVIGPAGGTLSVGPHKITIPKGALTRFEVITAELPVSSHVSMKLSPSGLRFEKPAQLMLKYSHCNRPAGASHLMVFVNDADEVLEWPTCVDDPKLDQIVGTIRHFSKYAVASN